MGRPKATDKGGETSEQDFKDILTQAGFTEKTVTLLIENDFASVESLDLIKRDPAVLAELGLTLQQRLLLKDYVGAFEKTPATTAQGSVGLQQVLSELTSGGQDPPSTASSQGATAAQPQGLADPLIYLKGGCNSKSKCLDILDYINMVNPVAEEHVMCEENGVQVLYRGGTKRPSIENVTVEEWCLSNTRIMNELLVGGELNHATLQDYMAYTVKVCDLFKRYDRVSVLQYDREYRYLQNLYMFRWGTDAPHLCTTCLRAKQSLSSRPASTNRGSQRAGQSKDVCRLFNTYNGCKYQDKCKYVHTCSEPGCKDVHSRARFHAPATKTPDIAVDPK